MGGDSEPPAQRLLGDRAFWCGSGLYSASWRLSVEILTTSDDLTYILLLLRIQAFLLSPHLMEERPLSGPVSPGAAAPEHREGSRARTARPVLTSGSKGEQGCDKRLQEAELDVRWGLI